MATTTLDELRRLLALPDLAAHIGRTEELVDEWLAGNPELVAPGRRVVHGGGKRLRPVLVVASAAAGGAPVGEPVLRGAASLELVHVGSLVHDDIIDHAQTRRGVPTVNAQEGVSNAILVGDYLLGVAGALAASVNTDVAMSLAVAITELCVGQSLETSSLHDADRTVEAYLRSIDGKTAALMRASCRIGAHAAGLDATWVEALTTFGTAFGMAFQIIDDVLDLVSTSEDLGKPAGNDLREGVYTLPTILYLADNPGAPRPGPGGPPEVVEELLGKVRASDGVEQAVDRARGYAAEARAALDGLPASAQLDGLARLPGWYVDLSVADL